jgi:hypothetical protein
MIKPAYYMNIHTGSVDTLDNWLAEDCAKEAFGASLFPVELADGSEVPEDFNPWDSNRFAWVEVA